MKKISIFLVMMFVLGLSVSAIAATDFDEDGTTVADSDLLSDYVTSTNVLLTADTSTDQASYIVAAGHSQGTKIYTSGSESATIDDSTAVAGDHPTDGEIQAAAADADAS